MLNVSASHPIPWNMRFCYFISKKVQCLYIYHNAIQLLIFFLVNTEFYSERKKKKLLNEHNLI